MATTIEIIAGAALIGFGIYYVINRKKMRSQKEEMTLEDLELKESELKDQLEKEKKLNDIHELKQKVKKEKSKRVQGLDSLFR